MHVGFLTGNWGLPALREGDHHYTIGSKLLHFIVVSAAKQPATFPGRTAEEPYPGKPETVKILATAKMLINFNGKVERTVQKSTLRRLMIHMGCGHACG